MKQKLFIATIFLLYFFSSCTANKFITTDEIAFYPDEDSLTVSSIIKELNASKDTTKYMNFEIPPSIIDEAKPDYPTFKVESSSYYKEGKVYIKLNVTKEGKVKRAYVAKTSDKLFNKVSLEAAMKYKFAPATRNGEPVDCWVVVPFKFVLGTP